MWTPSLLPHLGQGSTECSILATISVFSTNGHLTPRWVFPTLLASPKNTLKLSCTSLLLCDSTLPFRRYVNSPPRIPPTTPAPRAMPHSFAVCYAASIVPLGSDPADSSLLYDITLANRLPTLAANIPRLDCLDAAFSDDGDYSSPSLSDAGMSDIRASRVFTERGRPDACLSKPTPARRFSRVTLFGCRVWQVWTVRCRRVSDSKSCWLIVWERLACEIRHTSMLCTFRGALVLGATPSWLAEEHGSIRRI